MYDSILFPTDGSEAAERAAEHAYDLATQYDATLHVLHVVSVTDTTTIHGHGGAGAGYIDNLEEYGEDAVDTIATAAADRGIDTMTSVEHGSPEQMILEYADTHNIDLITMSTHGRSGVGRVLLGSVTERVLRQSNVPVVAIPRR